MKSIAWLTFVLLALLAMKTIQKQGVEQESRNYMTRVEKKLDEVDSHTHALSNEQSTGLLKLSESLGTKRKPSSFLKRNPSSIFVE